MTTPRLPGTRNLLPIGAGILAGVVSSLTLSFLLSRPKVAPQHTEASPPESREDSVELVRKLGELVALNSRLRAGPGEAPPPAADAPAKIVAPAPPPLRSREEQHAQQVALHEAHYQEIRAQPRSPAWSDHAEQVVGATLKNLASTGKFKMLSVDSRSTGCVADVGWQNTADARHDYRSLLQGEFGDVNCSREILVPDLADPTAPVSAHLLLKDCPVAAQ